MGKTFVGLADDATAAYSNPAGLSQLLDQEVSFEFTGTQIRQTRVVAGGTGATETFGDFVLTPSFLSYVTPWRRLTFSFFLNRIQDYSEHFEFPGRNITGSMYEDGAFGTIDVQIDNYGVGTAFVVNPWLSVGGSFVIAVADIAAEGRSGSPLNPRNGSNTIDSDTRLTGIFGVLVKPSSKLSFGATVNLGPTFELETVLFGDFLESGRDVTLTGERRPIDYVVPDRYAAGFAYRPIDAFTIAADLAYTLYSQRITEDFLIVDFQDSSARLTRDNFNIDDALEFHAGGEYRFYGRTTTVSLRGGVYTDPDDSLEFVSGSNNTDHPADLLLDFRFNTVQRKTDIGLTAGFGVSIANSTQFDVAGSFSDSATEVVGSVVITFGAFGKGPAS